MLTSNPTQMDSYNKHAKNGQGTLVANWFEERIHREQKGNGRALTKTHFPKKHENLLDSQGFMGRKDADDTRFRTIGDTNHPIGTTENYHYGKSWNKADEFQKVGRRQQMTEEMYLKQITEELEQEQRRKFEQSRKGHYETTNRVTYVPKPLDSNEIGRLVMRDQSGALVGLESVDEDLKESNGFVQRGQISKDEQLRKLVDTDNGYQRSQPITFWKQKMQDASYYMSKPGGDLTFGRNNQFLKTYKHYKHSHD